MEFFPRSSGTRQRIVKIAAELFNKKGVRGTSLSDLEKATGMTKGSIYGNFKDKNEVALAAFDYNWNQKYKILLEEAAECVSYKDKLLSHIRLHSWESMIRFTPGGCPLQNTAIEADDTNESLRDRAANGFEAWIEELVSIVERGKTVMEFRENADAFDTALHILSLIEGASLFFQSTLNPFYADRLLTMAEKVVADITVH